MSGAYIDVVTVIVCNYILDMYKYASDSVIESLFSEDSLYTVA